MKAAALGEFSRDCPKPTSCPVCTPDKDNLRFLFAMKTKNFTLLKKIVNIIMDLWMGLIK